MLGDPLPEVGMGAAGRRQVLAPDPFVERPRLRPAHDHDRPGGRRAVERRLAASVQEQGGDRPCGGVQCLARPAAGRDQHVVAVTREPHRGEVRQAINKRWYYVVKVTQSGKPARVKITAQIVDPLGGTHPVEFGPTTKKIINWPITGTYRDYIIWPTSSRGIPLKLRITLVGAHGTRAVVSYAVVPRA